MANESGPSHSHRRLVDNLDFVDQVEDVHIDVNDEHPTPVQGDTRAVKGMFDTFMQNFAKMSKTMSSVQKELNDLNERINETEALVHMRKNQPIKILEQGAAYS